MPFIITTFEINFFNSGEVCISLQPLLKKFISIVDKRGCIERRESDKNGINFCISCMFKSKCKLFNLF